MALCYNALVVHLFYLLSGSRLPQYIYLLLQQSVASKAPLLYGNWWRRCGRSNKRC